ncbi:MAG: ATP-grasp domain-containing protein [Phycisphaerales bacterium]
MARLLEHQGKEILGRHGLPVPRGGAAATPQEAEQRARELGVPVVVKIQAWTTGRAAIGGVAFPTSPTEAASHAARMLAMRIGQFPVTSVLVEEKLDIAKELFVSLSVDDRARSPVILFSAVGGSGIEDRAASTAKIACDVIDGPAAGDVRAAVAVAKLPEAQARAVEAAIANIFKIARATDARSVEINPLVITRNGRVMAADCRVTIDDYAVFRHPELGIEIARELDHPPTELERIAYRAEQEDHRGTFFFAQMNAEAAPGSKGLIGFHGAGGGGSMMSMDAITNEGFTIANFCDTSGNPSPAKVYRAARIILAQPGLVGYFGSGSGVANQEQFWSAYGVAKAFWELELDLPTVIRLGGNTEDRAVEILQGACKAAGLQAKVEGYKKTDPPAKIAARFAALVEEANKRQSGDQATSGWKPRAPRKPEFVGKSSSVSFAVKGGKVWIDSVDWKKHAGAIVLRAGGLLKDDGGKPAITLKPEELLMKDSDFIACEVECRRDGIDGLFVELEIPGLDALVAGYAKGSR